MGVLGGVGRPGAAAGGRRACLEVSNPARQLAAQPLKGTTGRHTYTRSGFGRSQHASALPPLCSHSTGRGRAASAGGGRRPPQRRAPPPRMTSSRPSLSEWGGCAPLRMARCYTVCVTASRLWSPLLPADCCATLRRRAIAVLDTLAASQLHLVRPPALNNTSTPPTHIHILPPTKSTKPLFCWHQLLWGGV